MSGAGGGKRKGRKTGRVEADDRPRGYEAQRMRQLWRDIEDAKHKAGLGPTPEVAAASPWDLAGAIERAAALAADVVAWVTATAPRACDLLGEGADLLRALPIVGRLVELVPTFASRSNGDTAQPRDRQTEGVRFTTDGATATPPEGAPNGHWIH